MVCIESFAVTMYAVVCANKCVVFLCVKNVFNI